MFHIEVFLLTEVKSAQLINFGLILPVPKAEVIISIRPHCHFEENQRFLIQWGVSGGSTVAKQDLLALLKGCRWHGRE